MSRLSRLPRVFRASAALAILIVGAAPALAPLAGDGTPATHDGHLHLQRIVALDRLAADGTPFSRWLPDLAYGYGLPVFNYYAPLIYAPALAARLAGATYVGAYELTAVLAVIGSAIGMYLLARSLFGTPAALAAGLVYAYLPYQLHNLYTRGALAETAAFAWLPLACWCLLRLRADGRARWLLGFALTVAGLILTHNITALIATPALAGLALCLAFAAPEPATPAPARFLARAALGLAAGLGLAAWFWMPAILEREQVQLGAMLDPALFDSFVLRGWPPFQESLAYDYRRPWSDALGVPVAWPRVGLVQLLVTILGAAIGLRAGAARGVVAWAAVLVLGAWALQFEFAAPLYDIVPLAAYVQFPWRLLVLVGLGSALLAGAFVDRFGRRPMLATAVGCAVALGSAWASLDRLAPEYEYPDDRFLTAETLVRAEQADYGLGTTHGGEYLPVAANQRHARSLWKELRDRDQSPGRNRREAPIELEIQTLDWGPTTLRATITAAEPARLLVHQFAYAGWAARLDGASVAVAPAGRFGSVAVELPAGTHELELAFGWTPLRLSALAVSTVAGLALLAYAASARRWAWGIDRRRAILARAGPAALALGCLGWLGSAASAGPAEARAVAWRDVDGQVALVGSRLDARRHAEGGPLAVHLEWLALATPRDGYEAVVRLEGSGGAAHEARWAHGALMLSWERGELVRTETNLRLPADFPAGPARAWLRLEGRDGKRAPDVPPLDLGPVSIPASRGAPPTRSFAAELGRPVLPGLELASYELLAEDGQGPPRVGEALDTNLEWAAIGPPPDELVAVVVLRGDYGELVSRPHTIGWWFNLPPGWQAGDRFRQQVRLLIPTVQTPGSYDASLRVYAGDASWAALAPHSTFSLRPRGRPMVEVPLGQVTVRP